MGKISKSGAAPRTFWSTISSSETADAQVARRAESTVSWLQQWMRLEKRECSRIRRHNRAVLVKQLLLPTCAFGVYFSDLTEPVQDRLQKADVAATIIVRMVKNIQRARAPLRLYPVAARKLQQPATRLSRIRATKERSPTYLVQLKL